MRLNNYLEFKKVGNGLEIFRVYDGKIYKLNKAEIKAIEYIMRRNPTKPFYDSGDSIFYEDLCSIYKEQFDRYCNLFSDSTKGKKNTVTSSNNVKKVSSTSKKTSMPKKSKKVNRKKSRKIKKMILRGAIRATLLAGVGFIGFNGVKGIKNMLTDRDSISYTDDRDLKRSNSDLESDNRDHVDSNVSDHDYNVVNVSNDSDVNGNINIKNLEFDYEYSDIGDKEALENAYQYRYYFEKYGNMYGIEPELLALIAAQESSGVHKEYSENGYATGLEGIENVWAGEIVEARNYQTNETDIFTVDYDRVTNDVGYNIQIAAMIFQQNFNAAVKNRGNLFSENELLAYAIQKYNFGSGNSAHLFEIGDDWISNRAFIDSGDSLYFEHVLSRANNGDTFKLMYYDEDTEETTVYSTTVYNYALEKGRSK